MPRLRLCEDGHSLCCRPSRRSLPMQFSSTARHNTRRREEGQMFGASGAECRTLHWGAELLVQEASGSVAAAGSRSGVSRCATRRG